MTIFKVNSEKAGPQVKSKFLSFSNELLLFDRTNDPHEMKNLSAEPKCQTIVAQLLQELVAEIGRTEPRMPRRICAC
jgi:hypothetical protein